MNKTSPSANAEFDSEHYAEPIGVMGMFLLAVFVGIITGFGSILFRWMIALVHNLLFSGEIDLYYDANIHADLSPWGIGVILVPVIGSFAVTWLVRTFAPEAKGHGVPEVMNAIHYAKAKIRPVVAIIKSLSAAISIGSGGSVGREGPIIQIGAAIGSALGQIITMPTRQRIILVAAGAGAGIASTFNAPISGLTFAIEMMLVSVSGTSVALVAIATVIATHIGQAFLGLAPSFDVPDITRSLDHILPLSTLFLLIPFGILLGVISVIYIRSIYWSEDMFEKYISNPYWRHALGMFVLGIMIYAFAYFSGHYYVQGVGYSTIVDLLEDSITNPWFLATLFVAKLVATNLTIGSGASGGVFSPSLFLGGTIGALFGHLAQILAPNLGVNPVFFTIAGMGGIIGGSMGAMITAIVMTFEMTRSYAAVLPVIVTVGIAHMIRITLCRDSIYTLKLQRRGRYLPQGLVSAVSSTRQAYELMNRNFECVEKKAIHGWFRQHQGYIPKYAIVIENNQILGMLYHNIPYHIRDLSPEQLINEKILFVSPTAPWDELLRKMQKNGGTQTMIVMRDPQSRNQDDIIGVITSAEIISCAQHAANLTHHH